MESEKERERHIYIYIDGEQKRDEEIAIEIEIDSDRDSTEAWFGLLDHATSTRPIKKRNMRVKNWPATKQ